MKSEGEQASEKKEVSAKTERRVSFNSDRVAFDFTKHKLDECYTDLELEEAVEYDSENNPEQANTRKRSKQAKAVPLTTMTQSASHKALRPIKKVWQKGRGEDRPQSAKGYLQITTTTTVKIEGLPVVTDL